MTPGLIGLRRVGGIGWPLGCPTVGTADQQRFGQLRYRRNERTENGKYLMFSSGGADKLYFAFR